MSGRQRHRPPAASLLLALAAFPAWPGTAAAQETHALIVVGLGGDPEYAERFHEWGARIRDALVELHGVASERVLYLGEKPEADPARIGGKATKEAVETALRAIAGSAAPADRVLVVLVGHGTSRGNEALLNLSGPDLSAGELDLLLDRFPTQQVAVVNAASASGPFVEALSGPRRTVVTATRTGMERNETWFGRFFAEALAGDGADLDKDGGISVLEAFEFARREVERHYREQNLLLTEHAMLDDDGDGKGTSEPGPDSGDGGLARTFILRTTRATAAAAAEVADPVLRELHREKAELERRLEALRAGREGMEATAYERELEEILVELALVGRKIREREGGGR